MFSKVDKKLRIEKYEEGIRKYVLSNGLTVYLHSDKSFKKCYANYMIDYGSNGLNFKLENQEYTLPMGVAHFLEHVMFRTADGGDYFDLYSELGTSSNAYTSYNQTSYIFSASSQIKENLEILIKQVQTLTIDEVAVEKEKGIIIEELQMYMQRPSYVFRKKMYEKLLSSNYKYDILGDENSIKSISQEILQLVFEKFYKPSNSILFISGNVDESIITFLESVQMIKDNNNDIVQSFNGQEDYSSSVINYAYEDKNSQNEMKMYAIKYKPVSDKREEIKLDITLELLEMYICSYINNIYANNMQKALINFSLSLNTHFHEDIIIVYLNITDNVEFDIKDFYRKSLDAITREEFKSLYNKKIAEEIRVFNDSEAIVESSIGIINRNMDLEDYYNILNKYNAVDFFNGVEKLKRIETELNLFLEKN